MQHSTSNPSWLLVAFHVLLTVLTGGLWLIVLLIWYLLKK